STPPARSSSKQWASPVPGSPPASAPSLPRSRSRPHERRGRRQPELPRPQGSARASRAGRAAPGIQPLHRRRDRIALAGAPDDVVVRKGGVGRVIGLRVAVDGEEVGQYSADGIVVATPTGSTAYSLSAGGPIVVPGVDAIVVAAICPHTLAVRPLVVPSQAEVAVEAIPPWTEDVLASFDGQVGTTMEAGARLVVKRADRPVLLVRLGPESFFARMRQKLQWGDLSDRERT